MSYFFEAQLSRWRRTGTPHYRQLAVSAPMRLWIAERLAFYVARTSVTVCDAVERARDRFIAKRCPELGHCPSCVDRVRRGEHVTSCCACTAHIRASPEGGSGSGQRPVVGP